MKKITTLCLAFICILSSCSKDDDQGSHISGDIVGNWIGTEMTYEGTIETEVYGVPVESDFTGEAFDISTELTFSENPNTLVSEGTYSVEIEYDLEGVKKIETIEDLSFLGSGTWEMDGDTLWGENERGAYQAKIHKLTENELVIGIVQTEDVLIGGTMAVGTVRVTAKYVR
ncbi:lipocalin family protein [Pseudotamlana agarivorans]|uniref:lipocalin family protein n=1 Tax=Pseudotamlana agarivorans TaxID=481183 RepID=UPI0008326FC3|nr:lipocalin family protein [Tamlana agarivorans]